MLIIPAIDIIDGKIVRLSKGKYNSVVEYAKTPLEQAIIYDELGFEWLHIVDLSGSKDGRINTVNIIEQIKNKTELKIEFGGGIRSSKDIINLDNIGIDGIIVGSLAVTNKDELQSALKNVKPNKIIIAADVLDYEVRIKGWTENSNIHIFDHIDFCNSIGLENYLCTDIAVDGMLTGPNVSLYNEILNKFPGIHLIASGGVGSLEDINVLSELNIRGIVVGKAIYENKIDIKELSKFAL